jgi:H+-translocating NAD(P) transhydrogenase subunit alpha
MPITIAVPKEHVDARVAVVPAVSDKYIKLGCNVGVQTQAGAPSYIKDEAYKGATVYKSAQEAFAAGDIVIKVQSPTDEEISQMKDGAVLISFLYPHLRPAVLRKLCEKKITCFALEMVPRTISRAQSMDVLSTQATTIGYKSVLIAADTSKAFFPMLATAAGTMRPSKVLIIGAGVAGLQAIATARRLGARVEAYDVRPETKEEVESLGAKFIDTAVSVKSEGGYARELTEEEKQKQQEILAKHIADSDAVIATAGVPGRPAPKIITQAMVEMMKPGAVIVDAVAEMGGNCVLTKAGETIDHNGVMIVGVKNIASSLSINASEMFAKNVFNFISPMIKNGELNIDWNDQVVTAFAATHNGEIANETFKKIGG